MDKVLLSIIVFASFCLNLIAQNVVIPDTNFKAYLVGQPFINTNSDSEIQVSEAQTYVGPINCSGLNISDLTGIEAFTSLTALNCSSNQISTLDVSLNITLTNLNCSNNLITSLALPIGSNLTTLNASSILLESLNLSMLTGLTSVEVQNNSIINSLNVANGNNEDFNDFDASNTPNLTCIDVDNVSYSDAVWIPWGSIDSGDQFSLDCSTLSTIDFDFDSKFRLYPNPVKSELFIATKLIILKVEIISITGLKILEMYNNLEPIDVSRLPSGVFLVNIITKEGIINKKIIKE
ncbi:T9SS type A sorting domain-containing protein [Winogradskyella sp.]|uniref:T9SS type A sorting domain-containing protein n=1 Tax=Winogradskyella sp. TaxID=1883156 RepID=UPI00262BBA12|nr:T9SS type A sorting domain-containing protein [Winogradskyella sp.]